MWTCWPSKKQPGPNPYAVTLSAGDPYALAEKVGTLFEFLQEQYPAASPVELPEEEADLPLRSPFEHSTPGRYEDANMVLSLPRSTTPATEAVATPMAIKILQLRDDSLLRNSLYELLDKDPAKALRSTYIRDDDYLLHPGQFKFIPLPPSRRDPLRCRDRRLPQPGRCHLEPGTAHSTAGPPDHPVGVAQ